MNYLRKILSIFIFAFILSAWMLAAEESSPSELIHVVGKGETIYSISRFYRITPEELMKSNGISDPSKLQTGKKLTIPSSAFSDITHVTVSVPAPVPAAVALVDYKVARGDTLFGIARTYEISLQTLLDYNKFSSDHVIKIGDVIKVPNRNSTSTGSTSVAVQNNPAANAAATSVPPPNPGLLSLNWPVNAKGVSYMTGQMGVVVEGEHSESVKSLTQGKVISAGPWRKFGKVAIVEASGGYLYMYGGCETLTVNVGDRISAGMELGKLGINTVSEKPQLFFMVFRSDTPIDPAKAPRIGSNAKT